MSISRGCVWLLFLMCMTWSVVNAAKTKPHLTITSITPSPGATITRSTVLKVTLDYSIDRTKWIRDTYYILPLFDSTESGHPFNALDRLVDGFPIKEASGVVEYEYGIKGEWDAGQLAKPVVVRFCLMKREGRGASRSIAQAEPVTYQTDPE